MTNSFRKNKKLINNYTVNQIKVHPNYIYYIVSCILFFVFIIVFLCVYDLVYDPFLSCDTPVVTTDSRGKNRQSHSAEIGRIFATPQRLREMNIYNCATTNFILIHPPLNAGLGKAEKWKSLPCDCLFLFEGRLMGFGCQQNKSFCPNG